MAYINYIVAKNKKKSIAVESDNEEDHEEHGDAKSVVSNVSSNTTKPAVKSKNRKSKFSSG